MLKGDKPREFVIVNPSDKNYVLTANTDEEQREWIEAISRLTEVEAKALNYTAGQVIEKRGLLMIKVKRALASQHRGLSTDCGTPRTHNRLSPNGLFSRRTR